MKPPLVLKSKRVPKKRDELGRKRCAKGDACVHRDGPWLPESEFYKRISAADGLDWACKACRNAYKKTGRGADKGKRRTQGGYICIKGASEWMDGWFSQVEMTEMLRWASWPEGMVFKQMRRGRIVRVVRVVGKQHEGFRPPRDKQILEREE